VIDASSSSIAAAAVSSADADDPTGASWVPGEGLPPPVSLASLSRFEASTITRPTTIRTAITRIIRCWLASRRRRARVTAADVESSKTVGRAPPMAGASVATAGTGLGRAHSRTGADAPLGPGAPAAAPPSSSSASLAN
jgi:hypothetical protein